ncbi:Rv3235 family protein [Microbacterium hominis]|uniref:3-hydroxyacyl-CoA dehydrogenase n=1 Tax=Microbacterium hominis TaxID=162426 RepID=A0A7D4TP09_9MICO|nr:Rv3235 family protein [Microbacterium hominis]QKJ19982.1 3-hydroxyacyl-CoA dehydrogenase [Microbacterium hominis]
MAQTPAGTARALPTPVDAAEIERFFGPQRTSTAQLGDPEPFLRNLTRNVLEVFAGVREAEHVARWMAEEPYRKLVVRANLSARARSARGVPAKRPVHHIMSVRHSSPADGVIEAVIIVRGPARTRAVAIRAEGLDGRLRATSVAIL